MNELELPGAAAQGPAAAARRVGKIVVASGTVLGVVGGTLVGVAAPASAATLVVTSAADDGSPGTLRSVLASASDGDIITFSPEITAIQLTQGELDVDVSVQIAGPGSAGLTVTAAPDSRVFDIYNGAPMAVTISGLTITGGNTEGDGGGILAADTDLALTDVVVRENTGFDGGGVAVFGGSLTMSSSVVSGNTSIDNGGGVLAASYYGETEYGEPSVTIVDSTISGNVADDAGGGAQIDDFDRVVISRTTISDNDATYAGGGLTLYGGFSGDGTQSVSISSSTVTGNVVTPDEGGGGAGGGGIAAYAISGTVDIDRTTITGNDAPTAGGIAIGAVFQDPESVGEAATTITNSTISGNSALGGTDSFYGGAGGGLLSIASSVHVLDTTIAGNDSAGGGGGIAMPSAFRVTSEPQALAVAQPGIESLVVERSTISGNTAVGSGAGVLLGGGKYFTLLNSTISGNDATGIFSSGGGLFVSEYFGDGYPSVNLWHSTIADNSAKYGGGVYEGGGGSPGFPTASAVVDDGETEAQANVAADHTIIADNLATDVEGAEPEGDGDDVWGTMTLRYSLVEDSGGEESTLIDEGGTNLFDLDPMLQPLADNGGPTQTHAPAPGSPVIDSGDPNVPNPPATDQRGLARVAGIIDRGSVEVQGPVAETYFVSVQATTPNAVEGGAPGVFTFTRTGGSNEALTVGYVLSGTASQADYEPIGTVTFAAGQWTVTKQLVARADDVADANETVTLTLSPTGGSFIVGSPGSATITIVEDPTAPPRADEPPCDEAPEDGFTDVGRPDADGEGGNVHEAAIDCAAHLGIAKGGPEGLPANQYGPALPVRRGQMASFLARLIEAAGVELPDVGPEDDAFDDDDGTTHEANINRLAAVGIVEGLEDGTFGEGEPVRRDQMASFLLRTYEYISGATLPAGPDAFDDDEGTDERPNVHEAAINALAAAGVIEGKGGRVYDPSGPVRRDQMASFLVRLADLLAEQGDFPVDEEAPAQS